MLSWSGSHSYGLFRCSRCESGIGCRLFRGYHLFQPKRCDSHSLYCPVQARHRLPSACRLGRRADSTTFACRYGLCQGIKQMQALLRGSNLPLRARTLSEACMPCRYGIPMASCARCAVLPVLSALQRCSVGREAPLGRHRIWRGLKLADILPPLATVHLKVVAARAGIQWCHLGGQHHSRG